MAYVAVESRQEVTRLKREGDLAGARSLLDRLMREQLEASEHPDPWPFEQSAIVRRQLKDREGEVEALCRFVSQACFRRRGDVRLYDRLPKALKLAGHPVEGREDLYTGVAAVVDTETTGLGPTDELIELAVLRFRFDKRTGALIEQMDEYHGLREPSAPVARLARSKHGLSDGDLQGRHLDEQRVSEMVVGCNLLIAHNAAFDRRFLSSVVPIAGSRTWTCTVSGIDWQARGHTSRKLSRLLKEHGVSTSAAHRALDDARGLLELLQLTDRDSGTSYLTELLSTGYEPRPASAAPQARPIASTEGGPTTHTYEVSIPFPSLRAAIGILVALALLLFALFC